MGPLASKGQVSDVGANAQKIREASELVYGSDDFEVVGADREKGAFFGPMLMVCDDPFRRTRAARHRGVRSGEHGDAIQSLDEAIELAKRGRARCAARWSRPMPTSRAR